MTVKNVKIERVMNSCGL